MTYSDSPRIFRFGDFEADVRSGELRSNGIKVALQEQPFQVLAVLLERPGEIVRREELRQQVWPQDTYVEFDHALNTAVKKIRIALGDDATAPRYIETIPKRGYRFVGAVKAPDDPQESERKSLEAETPHKRRWWPAITSAAALAVTLFGLLSLSGMRRRTNTHDATDKRIMLAVLPLEDWSDDAGHALLCDGLTQELIMQAGRADPGRLAVVPRATSLPYRHTTKTVAEVAHELHADYLVEGNLRSDARHVRVTVELIRVSDETRVWGDDFNRETGDSLALESEIAASITGKLKSVLFPRSMAER